MRGLPAAPSASARCWSDQRKRTFGLGAIAPKRSGWTLRRPGQTASASPRRWGGMTLEEAAAAAGVASESESGLGVSVAARSALCDRYPNDAVVLGAGGAAAVAVAGEEVEGAVGAIGDVAQAPELALEEDLE